MIMANIIENLNANEIDLGTLLGNDLVNDEYDDNPLITQAINCNYTDTTSLINQLPDDWRSSHNLLYVLHVNIQSLPAKFEKLKDIIIQFEERGLPLDVILICETFIRMKMQNCTTFQVFILYPNIELLSTEEVWEFMYEIVLNIEIEKI